MVDSALDKSAPGPWSGWLHGLLGVIIFSGSLPLATDMDVVIINDMDPLHPLRCGWLSLKTPAPPIWVVLLSRWHILAFIMFIGLLRAWRSLRP